MTNYLCRTDCVEQICREIQIFDSQFLLFSLACEGKKAKDYTIAIERFSIVLWFYCLVKLSFESGDTGEK